MHPMDSDSWLSHVGQPRSPWLALDHNRAVPPRQVHLAPKSSQYRWSASSRDHVHGNVPTLSHDHAQLSDDVDVVFRRHRQSRDIHCVRRYHYRHYSRDHASVCEDGLEGAPLTCLENLSPISWTILRHRRSGCNEQRNSY
jgi:hypothetical protein